MRMNTASTKTAAMIINQQSEAALATLFKTLGEERFARRIARRIVEARRRDHIRTSGQLVKLVLSAVPKKSAQRIHPATRTFMALRIAVNDELSNLKTFLASVIDWLKPNGRICVISFHSLEDRIVKRVMRKWARGCTCPPGLPQCACGHEPEARLVTRKVVRPAQGEIDANPMARSAKLRVAERISATTAVDS
jgi:16S rRNA (cytosine1402-N4)-methyltransferase